MRCSIFLVVIKKDIPRWGFLNKTSLLELLSSPNRCVVKTDFKGKRENIRSNNICSLLLPLSINVNEVYISFYSAKAIGRTEPDPSKVEILEDGIIVPQGKPIDQTKPKVKCMYIEL